MPHENGHDADRHLAGVEHAGGSGSAGASVALRPGGTLVVWRPDRLGRPLAKLAFLITDFAAEGTGSRSPTVFRKGG